MSKMVVLGADGFIGRHLTIALAKSFNGDIIAFDRFSSYVTGSEHIFNPYPNITIVPGNFFGRTELAGTVKDADFVFHLISTTNPATSDADPLIDIDTNIRGSVDLFKICSENGVGKVIFFSSGGTVYGETNDGKIKEETLPKPRSPYGIGKLAIEHYLRYFKFAKGLDYIVYRIANPYGPGQNILGKQGVIPIFMHKMIEKEPITVFGKGDMVRDYIYIDDLIEMIVGSYDKSNKHCEYNLGSGKGVDVNQIITAIENCVGRKAEKEHADSPPTFIQEIVLDNTRFVSEFKLPATTSLEEGLQRTWDHVKTIS